MARGRPKRATVNAPVVRLQDRDAVSPAKQAASNTVAQKKDIKEVKKLIDLGKEKGYLTYDEVNDMLPADVVSPDQIDDVMSLFGEMDIEVIDSNQRVSLAGQAHPLIRIDNFDIHLAEERHDVVDLVGRDDIGGQHVVDLVIGQVALLLAEVDELLDLLDVLLLRDGIGGGLFRGAYCVSVLEADHWRINCRSLRTTSCHSSILSFLVFSSFFSSAM